MADTPEAPPSWQRSGPNQVQHGTKNPLECRIIQFAHGTHQQLVVTREQFARPDET